MSRPDTFPLILQHLLPYSSIYILVLPYSPAFTLTMTFRAPALPINVHAANPTQRRRRARLLGILLGAAAVAPASAAEMKWPAGPYNYIALDQDLRDALTEFGRNTG